MLNHRISPFGPLLSVPSSRHGITYGIYPVNPPILSPWPLDLIYNCRQVHTMLDPSSSATRTSLQRALTDGIMRGASSSLSLSLFCRASAHLHFCTTYLPNTMRAHSIARARALALDTPRAKMLFLQCIYYLRWFIVLTIFSTIRMHIVEVSDSSNERMEGRERENKREGEKKFSHLQEKTKKVASQ